MSAKFSPRRHYKKIPDRIRRRIKQRLEERWNASTGQFDQEPPPFFLHEERNKTT